MAKGPFYNVPYRRRREGKTNYKLRKKLILSGLPRIVARRTRNHIIIQLVKPALQGDQVITSAHSRELSKKYGWLGGLSNTPASYLTGLVCGYRSVAKGVKEAILDIGLQTPSKSSRVFAALKGVLDAGVDVPSSEDVVPSEARTAGKHIGEYAVKISSDADAYSRMFSAYLSRGLHPEKMPDHFSAVRKKIVSEFEKAPAKV